MFIVETIKPEEATGELKLLFRKIKNVFGFIPPHFELFATIDIEGLKSFMEYNVKMMNHLKIIKELLPLLRLSIAQTECRKYCSWLNTQILQELNFPTEIIANLPQSLDELELPQGQIVLLKTVLKALDKSEEFTGENLTPIYENGFSDKDFFDLLYYASDFTAKSKMIEIYLKK